MGLVKRPPQACWEAMARQSGGSEVSSACDGSLEEPKKIPYLEGPEGESAREGKGPVTGAF